LFNIWVVFRCAVNSPEPRSSRHSPLQLRFEVASQLHGAVLEFGSCAAGLEHPAFSVTLRFIVMFTGACHWVLNVSQFNLFRTFAHYLFNPYCKIMYFSLRYCEGFLHFGLSGRSVV
jgi:hypothetical protein